MRRCTPAELDRPASAWNCAAAHPPPADPFCCRTEWQLSFHEAFHGSRPLHLRAAGDSVIAFAELRDASFGTLLEPVESHWLFGCPLLGTDAIELLVAFLAEQAARPDSPSVLLSGLVHNSTLLRRIVTTFQSRYDISHFDSAILRNASLDGGFDGYLSRRSGSLRRNLRQAERRAADSGVRYERHAPTNAADAAALYERMLAVENASWKGLGKCGMAEPPSLDFYARMMRRLAASGSGRVILARCDDRDIGFIFGGLAGAVYRGQQFSFVEDWRTSSIGNLLQLEQLRWLGEEGATRYDMGPLMEYKLHWTEAETRIAALLLRPLSSGG